MTDTEPAVKLLISVCEMKDIGAWEIASKGIVTHIRARRYQLVCPDSQVEQFRSVTGSKWEIVGESGFAELCSLDTIREKVTGENRPRVHWLFQQFIKLNAVVQSGLQDDDVVVIWDADTVPLRSIDFVGPNSCELLCYHGTERHQPYFDTIEKLFGFRESTGRSFIAQCLPVRAGWVREMAREIESGFSMPYSDAVLGLLPGLSGSEFSEYETLGSWIFRHHPGKLVFKKKSRWLRSGPRLFGASLSQSRASWILRLLACRYDFVAIEKWDRPLGFNRLWSAMLRRLRS